LVEAQRTQPNPTMFDGIIAGAPALDYTGLVATSMAWTTRANAGPNGRRLFDPAKVPLVQRAVLQACDAADGLQDGLISEPRRCDFDPTRLQCAAGANDTAQCLTETEVGVLRRWYGAARNSRGEQLYPGGIPLGSEPFWPVWLAGTPGEQPVNQPLNPAFNRDFLRYMAFADDPGDAYDPLSFDFDRDPQRLAPMAGIYNATNPELRDFQARNGRLIVYQGWADAVVPPERTIQWFDEATQAVGGRAAMDSFARLFMIPGFDHCGLSPAGPGITETGFDPLTALERWVEANEPPAQVMTQRPARDGQPAWSRPVCPWPQVARHRGGATTDGANFECVDP
jgi:feruloyl esterase